MKDIHFKNRFIDTRVMNDTIINARLGNYPKDYHAFDYLFNRILVSRFANTPQKRKLIQELYVNTMLLRNEYILPADMVITRAEMNSAFAVLMYDAPELMHVNYEFSYSYSGERIISVRFCYAANAFKSMEMLITVLLFYKNLFEGRNISNAFEYELLLHDSLCNKCSYTHTGNDQNAYGVIKEGLAVCAGYSKAFALGMLVMGIPCCCIGGKATSPKGLENHEWNLIQLDGCFYYVDVTWDDTVENGRTQQSYAFFNVTDDEIRKTHFTDEKILRFFTPNCVNSKHNYYVYKNKLIRHSSLFKPFIARELSDAFLLKKPKDEVSVKFLTAADYDYVVRNLSTIVSEVLKGTKVRSTEYSILKEDNMKTLPSAFTFKYV